MNSSLFRAGAHRLSCQKGLTAGQKLVTPTAASPVRLIFCQLLCAGGTLKGMNGGGHRDGAAAGDGPADVRQPLAPVGDKDCLGADGHAAGFDSPFVALRVAKFGNARCADDRCDVPDAEVYASDLT